MFWTYLRPVVGRQNHGCHGVLSYAHPNSTDAEIIPPFDAALGTIIIYL